jgi:large subunit ribosomal protein L23
MSSEEKLLKILLRPYVSEKSSRVEAFGQYVFKVIADATKCDIKKAVELLFKVKVKAVRICNVRSKVKRFGRVEGLRAGWKKAYVSLGEGQSIDFGALK